MKTKEISPRTRRTAFLLILSMIVVTAGSALSVVWLQQQISRTAERSRQLENDLAETVRKLNYLDERIATMHQPVVLQGKVAGTLRPSMENQVVWVRERPVENGRAYAVSEPYETSMDLALIDLPQR